MTRPRQRMGLRGHGLRDGPHRLTGTGPPDLHRPRPADGKRYGPLWHSRSRPPVGVRACPLTRGPGLPGGDGAAANYGRANRQLLTEATRRVFERTPRRPWTCSTTCHTTWPRSKSIPSTAAPLGVCASQRSDPLPAARPSRPAGRPCGYRPTGAHTRHDGDPSYVLAGVPDNPAFFSTAHGAGPVQSRHQAARRTSGDSLRRHLEAAGILVRGSSPRGLAEEKPEAYKDIDAVIEISHDAGLARKIARLVPLGVVKG